jgi:hypothetical protein
MGLVDYAADLAAPCGRHAQAVRPGAVGAGRRFARGVSPSLQTATALARSAAMCTARPPRTVPIA